MQITTASPAALGYATADHRSPAEPLGRAGDQTELREAFDDFVGQTFFGQMLASMRKTVGKPAYLHGGRGEEVFSQHLDQVLAEELSESSASQFSGPMFEQFLLGHMPRA
jgi:hypothetical protein